MSPTDSSAAVKSGGVDWPSFLTCIAIVLLVSVPLAVFPEAGERLLTSSYDFIAEIAQPAALPGTIMTPTIPRAWVTIMQESFTRTRLAACGLGQGMC